MYECGLWLFLIYRAIGAAGFEPTTPTTPKWCATKLRYAPFFNQRFTSIAHQANFDSVHEVDEVNEVDIGKTQKGGLGCCSGQNPLSGIFMRLLYP
jgi:hypothetical protein